MRNIWMACVILLLAGCATNTVKLKQKIPDGATIATVALFHDKALFKETGFTKWGNKRYFHSVPNLDLNATAMTALNNELKSTRQYKVVTLPVNKQALTKVPTHEVVTQGDIVGPFYKNLLGKVVDNRARYLIMVLPSKFHYEDGSQHIAWTLPEYGVYNHNILGIKAAYAYGAFDMYVLDTNTWRVLAKHHSEFSNAINNDILKDDYMQVSPASLAELGRNLETNMTAELRHGIKEIGLHS
jgi:hypothetical protein